MCSHTSPEAGISELQTRRGNRVNSEIIFFLFLNKNIYCDPSLELSRQDGSNEGSQYMFKCKYRKVSLLLLLICGTDRVFIPSYINRCWAATY